MEVTMEKKYKLYQMTSEGPWYLQELLEKDGRVGWLNTFDETKALVLNDKQMLQLAVIGLRHGKAIGVVEVE